MACVQSIPQLLGVNYESNSIKIITELFKHLQMTLPQVEHNEPFEISAVTLTGRIITIKIRPLDTILHIKKEIYRQDQLPLDQQRLVFDGKRLEDDKLIYEYGIQANSRIHLILRLRGGMFHASSSRNDYLSLSYNSKEMIEKGVSMIKYMRNKYPADMMDKMHSILLECNEDEIESIVKILEQYYLN
jgi:hypothetical protein